MSGDRIPVHQLRDDFVPKDAYLSREFAQLEKGAGNMTNVQQDMKTRGFTGSRTNPKQEAPVANFHRVIGKYLDGAG